MEKAGSLFLLPAFPFVCAPVNHEDFLPGSPPALFEPPAACLFEPRCPYAREQCRRSYPDRFDCGGGHLAACFAPLPEEVTAYG